ncbi:MAG: YgjV family protein [Oscillospiraceae bacterium]|nr:YgjV family protein [Oscillospiraceae bacterium]
MSDFISAHSFVLAQIFGFIAMGLAILTYQFNKQKTVNIMLMIVAAVWCVHYAFLGLITPIAMNFVNVVRAFVYSRREKKWASGNCIPIIFIAVSIILVIFTWESYWSLLPCVASVFASLANWQTDTKKLRALTVPVCVCWLIYNAVNGSIAGAANETFTLISIAVAFFRYDRKKND